MDSLYDGRKKTGYSSEEAYFHTENQKLIQKIREQNKGSKTQDSRNTEGVVIDASTRFQNRREQVQPQKNKKAA